MSLNAFAFSSPCEDSLYVELSKTDSTSLSQTEAFYLHQKKDECKAYNDSLQMAQQDSLYQTEKEARWQKKKTAIIFGVVCGVIAQVIVAIAIVSAGGEFYVTF
jgi:hypothetical protein